jgi:DNA-binding MarR family transcriptional regulator
VTSPFDTLSEPLPRRLAAGIARLSAALRAGQWRLAEAEGLTPTQAQIIGLLARRGALRVSAVADLLGVTRPTAGDAVAALERKALLVRTPDPQDGRAVSLKLTPRGRAVEHRAGAWPAVLIEAADELPPAEQAALLRLVMRMILGLQRRGAIAPGRLCITCRYFRPFVHGDPAAPHHCAFVDAPFGERHLRLDCPEHDPAAPDAMAAAIARYFESPPVAAGERQNP